MTISTLNWRDDIEGLNLGVRGLASRDPGNRMFNSVCMSIFQGRVP